MSGSKSIVESSIVRLDENGSSQAKRDEVSVEEPLEIRCNQERLLVTMRTPGKDEELAIGYLASEGVIEGIEDVVSIDRSDVASHPENVINVTLPENCMAKLRELERYGAVSSSCGVCGRKTLDTACEGFSNIESGTRVSRTTLFEIADTFEDHQVDFLSTGGLHAAGLFTSEGTLFASREDIGRHNAVDKVIGAAMREGGIDCREAIMMVSGRVSFDIAQKALAAGIPVLAAVSAPSSLAISLAREKGQMLVGFLRRPTMNIYAHPQRLSE